MAPLRVGSAILLFAAVAAFGDGFAPGPPDGEEEPASVLLIRAKTALDDGLAPLAEQLARSVYEGSAASAGERSSAFDILFLAVSGSMRPEEVLALLDSGDIGGIPLPQDGRAALWRSDALLQLGRAKEAVAALQEALPAAAPGPATRIRRRIPAALLAAGRTDEALAAYEGLQDELARGGSPELPAVARARARILHSLGRDEEAVALLDLGQPMAADQLAATRLMRAELLMASRPDEAEALLREGADDARFVNRPYRAGAYLLLAELAARASPTNAVPLAEAAAEVAPDAATLFAAWSRAAEAYCVAGLPKEADPYLRKALGVPPPDPGMRDDLLNRCATALLEAGVAEAALALFDELAAGCSSAKAESLALFGRGRCLVAQGRLDSAMVAFTRSCEIAPPDIRGPALFHAATAMRDAGDLVQAAETFAKAADPASGFDDEMRTRAAYRAASCLAAADPSSGGAALVAFADAHPGTRDAAIALLESARLAAGTDAETLFSRAIQEARTSGDQDVLCSALIENAVEAARVFAFDAALADLDQAARIDVPRARDADYLRVLALFDLGRIDDAVEACRAICDSPDPSARHADATLWLGKYDFNARHYSEASERLLAFAETWPDRPEAADALLTVARAMMADSRWEDASSTATRLATLFPQSEYVAAARAIQGESLKAQLRFDEAIPFFDEILRAAPGTPEARAAAESKGTCLFALGNTDVARYSEAEDCFRQLRDDAPFAQKMQLTYKIGRCRERLGDVRGAFDSYYSNVASYEAPSRSIPPAARRDAEEWYSKSLLNAAELAAASEECGGRPTAIRLLKRLADTDLPGHAKAEETLRRLEDNP